MKFVLFSIVAFSIVFFSCDQEEKNSDDSKRAIYQMPMLENSPEINAVWSKEPWEIIEPLQIGHFMGDKPDHFPLTQAKLGYDEKALFIIFKVDDQYVKAVYDQDQDPVYKDSCVEFFFTPEDNSANGYFNLEMNCGGTMLFQHQMIPREGHVKISKEDIEKIEVAHSLPKIVDPEINKKTTWVVEYRIPFEVLEKYHSFSKPENGQIWRANFYKCADDSSHPHWLTWSPVDFPRPNFHLPEYFGILEFRD